MFFKFDSLSGRVVPSATAKVYNPAGLTPAAAEAPKQSVFIFESSKVKAASIDVVADGGALSKHAAAKALGIVPADAGYGKVISLQKKWALDDGLMVWQKRGLRDSGPYFVTLAGIAFGATYSFYLIYKMSFPKRQE